MKYLDFTNTDEDGLTEGLYVKKYRDGDVLVKIFFTGWTSLDEAEQDEVESWLTREQVKQLIETLQEG